MARQIRDKKWGIPGGILDRSDKSPIAGAHREFEEECCVPPYGKPGRRDWVSLLEAKHFSYDYKGHTRMFVNFVDEAKFAGWLFKANGVDLRSGRCYDLTSNDMWNAKGGHGMREMDTLQFVNMDAILKGRDRRICRHLRSLEVLFRDHPRVLNQHNIKKLLKRIDELEQLVKTLHEALIQV